MSIPINNVSPRIQYTATASQTVFSVPFPFFEDSDLLVYLTPVGTTADDATDLLTIVTDYTVTGAGNANGGTVTLVSGASNGDIVTIIRAMPEERQSLYLQGGLLTAEQLNDDFSMDVMMNQQNQMRVEVLTPHYQDCDVVTSADLELPILGAGQCWVMNSNETAIEATDFAEAVSQATTASSVTVIVNQTAHGFVVGDVLRCNGISSFTKAQADSAANAEVVGIVQTVNSANQFILAMGGAITGLSGLSAGSAYYLSPSSAGAYTASKPSTAGQVIKPLFVAFAPTAAFWTNMLGVVL